MGLLTEKLDYTAAAKQQIATAINKKVPGAITPDTPFSQYAEKIGDIQADSFVNMTIKIRSGLSSIVRVYTAIPGSDAFDISYVQNEPISLFKNMLIVVVTAPSTSVTVDGGTRLGNFTMGGTTTTGSPAYNLVYISATADLTITIA